MSRPYHRSVWPDFAAKVHYLKELQNWENKEVSSVAHLPGGEDGGAADLPGHGWGWHLRWGLNKLNEEDGTKIAFCFSDKMLRSRIRCRCCFVRGVGLGELVTGLVIIYVWIAPICPALVDMDAISLQTQHSPDQTAKFRSLVGSGAAASTTTAATAGQVERDGGGHGHTHTASVFYVQRATWKTFSLSIINFSLKLVDVDQLIAQISYDFQR